ncbi:transposase [Alcanivorax sp. JB21]|uniref:REP-associated tyrosine transposase n=1 Tax=Alcanivorax limicola TaxID=2874102 RepID=UPI001CC1A224|nr:transposase [Alcanivorax limicola]MBZ2189928.1 transposase [Alcanivorax limicola]
MARPLRIEFAGALYHVTARGNARADIYNDSADRHRFLNILTEVCKRCRWHCHAWCLMDNHYHLLVETGSATLSSGMRQLNGIYSQYFNRRHQRAGHLFQGRYKSILVEKESYLLELARYIVLNPVRAGMVQEAGEWRWSSYRATAGLAPLHPCLTRDWVLAHFGSRLGEATRRYKQFVRDGKKQPAPWVQLKNQIYLGSDAFIEHMHAALDAEHPLTEIPRAQQLTPIKPLSCYETHHDDRKDAMARAWLDGHYTLATIGEYFGVSRSSVSRAVKALRGKCET